MKKKIIFKKLSEKWFIDIPYDGSIEDLEMVDNAHLMLESIAQGNDSIRVEVYDTMTHNTLVCTLIDQNSDGAIYSVDNWDAIDCPFKGEIWLCNVTKLVFGGFPPMFYIKI